MCGFINGEAHGPLRNATVCQTHMRHFKDGDTLRLSRGARRPSPCCAISSSIAPPSTASSPRAATRHPHRQRGRGERDPHREAGRGPGHGGCCLHRLRRVAWPFCPNAAAALFTGAKIAHLGHLPRPARAPRPGDLDDELCARREGFGHCTTIGECEAVCSGWHQARGDLADEPRRHQGDDGRTRSRGSAARSAPASPAMRFFESEPPAKELQPPPRSAGPSPASPPTRAASCGTRGAVATGERAGRGRRAPLFRHEQLPAVRPVQPPWDRLRLPGRAGGPPLHGNRPSASSQTAWAPGSAARRGTSRRIRGTCGSGAPAIARNETARSGRILATPPSSNRSPPRTRAPRRSSAASPASARPNSKTSG